MITMLVLMMLMLILIITILLLLLLLSVNSKTIDKIKKTTAFYEEAFDRNVEWKEEIGWKEGGNNGMERRTDGWNGEMEECMSREIENG